MWRSGRPYQDAEWLDLDRLGQFVRGYANTTRLSAADAGLIPLFLYGRGLQMIAKRVRGGRAETGMLTEIHWLIANETAVAETVAAALP